MGVGGGDGGDGGDGGGDVFFVCLFLMQYFFNDFIFIFRASPAFFREERKKLYRFRNNVNQLRVQVFFFFSSFFTTFITSHQTKHHISFFPPLTPSPPPSPPFPPFQSNPILEQFNGGGRVDTGRLTEEDLHAIVEELEPLATLPNPVDLVILFLFSFFFLFLFFLFSLFSFLFSLFSFLSFLLLPPSSKDFQSRL